MFAAALYVAVMLQKSIALSASLLFCALCLISLAVFFEKRYLRTILLLTLSASMALTFLSAYDAVFVSPIRALHSQTLNITGTLCQDPTIYDDCQRAELQIEPSDNVPRAFRTLCYLPLTEESLLIGDQVELQAKFYLSGDAEGFDRATFQASSGCFISSEFVKDDNGRAVRFSVIKSSGKAVWQYPQRIARYCKQIISESLPEREGSLLNALLLGDKSGLSRTDSSALRKSGLSHLVAVSGLHVGFLVAFCYLLFGRRWGTVLSVLVILLFIPMAGATPSVIRAGIMYLVAAGGFLLRKEADSLNSLFLALLILLLSNPYAIASLSLQLSFAATLGLILFSGKLQCSIMRLFSGASRPMRSTMRFLAGAVSCTICASLFTMPILFSTFGYVSVLSLLSNLLVVGVTAVCFIGGLLLCVFGSLHASFAIGIAFVLRPFLSYILRVAELVSSIPFGLIYWEDAFGIAALFLFFATVWIWMYAATKVRWRVVLPCVILMLISLTAVGTFVQYSQYQVTYLPCGSGQSILISRAPEKLTVIDCSSTRQDAAELLEEWMLWHNFDHIDTLILTAVDKGHARSLPDVIDRIPIEKIIIPEGCKRTKHNGAYLDKLDQTAVPVNKVSDTLQISDAPKISLFSVTDGKLGVQIGSHTLVLHSPTQKQLAAYLADHSLTAPNIVLNQGQTSEIDLLRQACTDLQAETIILQAGSHTMRQFNGIPILSPYQTGELMLNYKKD